MSWDILPKSNLQYFLQKLKEKFDLKADKGEVEEYVDRAIEVEISDLGFSIVNGKLCQTYNI